jgi:hypothetical protein
MWHDAGTDTPLCAFLVDERGGRMHAHARLMDKDAAVVHSPALNEVCCDDVYTVTRDLCVRRCMHACMHARRMMVCVRMAYPTNAIMVISQLVWGPGSFT